MLSSARHLRSRDEHWSCVKVTVAPKLRPARSKHLAWPCLVHRRPIAAREARARKRRRLWRRESGSARRRRSSAFAHLSSLTATKVYSASNNADSLCRVTDGAPGRGGKGSGTALIAGLEERGRTDSVKALHRGGDCAGTEYLWRCRPCCARDLRRLGDRGGHRTGPCAHGLAGSRDACRPLTDAASPGEAVLPYMGTKLPAASLARMGQVYPDRGQRSDPWLWPVLLGWMALTCIALLVGWVAVSTVADFEQQPSAAPRIDVSPPSD